MKPILAISAAFVAAVSGTPAEAGQATAVMQVRATVVESCSASADPLDFALETATGAKADGQASVKLSCTGPAAYEIGLDMGQNGARRMIDPISGAALAYEIYSDPTRSIRWGNAVGIDTVAGTANIDGKAVLTAYGTIVASAEQTIAGTYSDTVVVTVNF